MKTNKEDHGLSISKVNNKISSQGKALYEYSTVCIRPFKPVTYACFQKYEYSDVIFACKIMR